MVYIDPRGKLMQHLDRLHTLQQGGKPAPINVEIDLSNRCSLGCEWCHFAHTHTRGPLAHKRAVDAGDLMNTTLLLHVLDDLKAAGVQSVTWSGGGEPTLHPDFDHIVSVCPLPQGMYTNGQHMNAVRAAIIKQRMAWVYVSLDAHDAESYARDKGVSATQFDRACEGVRQLVAADGNATVGVGMLLDAHNWTHAADMADLARELGADYVQFRPVIHYDATAPGTIDGPTGWIDVFLSWWEMTNVWRKHEIDLSRFEMLRDWKGHEYPVCWWSALQTVITPDGRVWTCLNKRGYDGACIGDLNTQSFAELWAAAPVHEVNDQCRVMCRGHIPNTTLAPMMDAPHQHKEFV